MINKNEKEDKANMNIIKLSKKFIFLICILVVSVIFYPHSVSSEETTKKVFDNPSKGIFIVQAGAFTDFTHAKSLRQRLDDRGFNAYIILCESKNNEILYKVGVGKFIKREDAENLSMKINNEENFQTFTTLEPLEGIFVVQAGAFNDLSYAKVLRKKLDDRGYNAYIIFSAPNMKPIYKVCIGEFIDKSRAEKLSEKINEEEHLQTFVTLK